MFGSNSCIVCGDSISDPICRSCYLKQTLVLLNDLNLHYSTKRIILSKLKTKFSKDTLNDAECILCNSGNISLCLYCFSVALTKILKSLNFPEDLIESFGYHSMPKEFLLQDSTLISKGSRHHIY